MNKKIFLLITLQLFVLLGCNKEDLLNDSENKLEANKQSRMATYSRVMYDHNIFNMAAGGFYAKYLTHDGNYNRSPVFMHFRYGSPDKWCLEDKDGYKLIWSQKRFFLDKWRLMEVGYADMYPRQVSLYTYGNNITYQQHWQLIGNGNPSSPSGFKGIIVNRKNGRMLELRNDGTVWANEKYDSRIEKLVKANEFYRIDQNKVWRIYRKNPW